MDDTIDFSNYIKLVLPYGTGDEDFAELAQRQGFEPVGRGPEDLSRHRMLTVTYQHPAVNALVQYVRNYKISIATARCFGVDRGTAADMLKVHLRIVDEAEIAERLGSETPGDRCLGMAYLAELAPQYCEESLLAFFVRGLGDPEKNVRELAYLAAGIAAWPELLAPAKKAAAAETDASLQGQAQRLVASLSTG